MFLSLFFQNHYGEHDTMYNYYYVTMYCSTITGCHRKTAACHVTNPSMCYNYSFTVLNCTLLYAIDKYKFLLLLLQSSSSLSHRHIALYYAKHYFIFIPILSRSFHGQSMTAPVLPVMFPGLGLTRMLNCIF